jgi:hypothetical protein
MTSKKTDPDKCTAERTSDNASALIGMILQGRLRRDAILDAKASLPNDQVRTIAILYARARNPAAQSFSGGDG